MAENTILDPSQAQPIRQPVEIVEPGQSPYSTVLQGKPLHAFLSSSTSPQNIELDDVARHGTINSDGVIITIDFDKDGIYDISPQAFKVLIILLDKLTSQLPHPQSGTIANADAIQRGRIVKVTLSHYMEMCNIKDVKEARSQLNDAIKALYRASLEWDEQVYERPEGKSRAIKVAKHHRMRITDHTITQEEGNPVKLGIAEFRFSFDLAEYLSKAYIMPYHPAILTVNTRYHPYSIPFGWKLCVLYNMNYGKSTQGITTVETLLKAAKGIPRYSTIAEKGQIYARIIKPFDRDLTALLEAGVISSYWYFDDEGEKVEPPKLGGLSYTEFSKLNIQYELSNYPDQTPRIEAKSKRMKAAISHRKNATKKKVETTKDGAQT